MRTKRKTSSLCVAILSLDFSHTSIRVASPVEPLLLFKTKTPDGEEYQVLRDDIYLLFNQQRISQSVGLDNFNNWISSLAVPSDGLSELRKKCSDDELLKFCKSRHLQSPSELLAWSEYLNLNYDQEIERLKSFEDSSVSEPSSSPTLSTE